MNAALKDQTQPVADAQGDDTAGRAMVRRELIQPCMDAGLKRAKGQSERALADSHDHLCAALDHMTVANLQTLRDVVIEEAAKSGPSLGVWPAAVVIINWGRGLQARPFTLHRIVSSWLFYASGPEAEAGGYLVQLFRFLRRHCRPPTAHDLREIKEQAGEDNRRLSLISDRIERGVVQQQDRDWYAAYMADERTAQGFVDAGKVARAKKTEGVAA